MNLGAEFVLAARSEINREPEKMTVDQRIEWLVKKRAEIEQEIEDLSLLKDAQDQQDTIESNRPGLY